MGRARSASTTCEMKQTGTKRLAKMRNAHMSGALGMDIHMVRALDATKYPTRFQHQFDELGTGHRVYDTHNSGFKCQLDCPHETRLARRWLPYAAIDVHPESMPVQAPAPAHQPENRLHRLRGRAGMEGVLRPVAAGDSGQLISPKIMPARTPETRWWSGRRGTQRARCREDQARVAAR